ncbi:hypothetical protein FALBO_17028 [Fusarium albosuccineum]|uniref:Uncharacterized protein n=1 Tax=Fusarium albosuccineum TaxID=1237068 RepID=A0A8H4KCI9_9HYPO|nr:hypothetical protein FALBO_17028 [Fusarium albosuccineum]
MSERGSDTRPTERQPMAPMEPAHGGLIQGIHLWTGTVTGTVSRTTINKRCAAGYLALLRTGMDGATGWDTPTAYVGENYMRYSERRDYELNYTRNHQPWTD